MTSLSDLLRSARRRLAGAGVDTPDLDARLIVEHFSGTTRTQSITGPDLVVPSDAVAQIESALSRRAAGEPVHRILGFREFYGLRLGLSPDTLEPRPDTEALVDAALPFLRATAGRTGHCRILDLGTGTGAIALALLAQIPQATAVGVDISAGALDTAARNAAALGLGARFAAVRSDWFGEISGVFDAIVSNPPYIASEEVGRLERDVRDFDPRRALDGGRDGLDAYRRIAIGADPRLAAEGIVAVEIGAGQGAQVRQIFADAGYGLAVAASDLGGHERALVFRRKA